MISVAKGLPESGPMHHKRTREVESWNAPSPTESKEKSDESIS